MAAMSFQFTGKGTAQKIRIVTESSTLPANGTGAMIDNIALTEKLPLNAVTRTVIFDSPPSQQRWWMLMVGDAEACGSSIPVGATLTDGTNSFVAANGSTIADITNWNLATLSVLPPVNFNGNFTLQIVASATETANGSMASSSANLTVTVMSSSGGVVSPIVLDLDGDGIHTTALGETDGTFDLLNNGTPIRSGWLSSGDGFPRRGYQRQRHHRRSQRTFAAKSAKALGSYPPSIPPATA